MKIGLASDHAGFKLKKEIIKHLKNKYPKIEVVDFGTKSKESTDYPIYAKKNAYALRDKEIDRAIFICGSGIGISIAASKVEGVMAPLFHFPWQAGHMRRTENINAISLSEQAIPFEESLEIVDSFITTKFEGKKSE